MTYYFHPAAEAEHLETVVYYESKKPGLGASYLAEFDKTIMDIAKFPSRYRIKKPPNIRSKEIGKFPFTIYYRTIHNSVQVLAVAHHRREPEYWTKRP